MDQLRAIGSVLSPCATDSAIESDQLQIQTMPLEIQVSMVAGPSAPLQDMFREFHH